MERLKRRGMSPIAILPLGFLGIIVVGTILLTLPISSVGEDTRLSVVDALFTSTSAVCVTGLTVIDTGLELTTFGQVILLILIQCGGLGFMTLAAMLFMMLGKRFSLHDRMTMAESMAQDKLQGVVKMSIYAIALTFTIELVGACVLMTRFVPEFGFGKGVWYSVFHSVSAFCNAGFDITTDGGNSIMEYVGDPVINMTLISLITLGGLGFSVLVDIMNVRERRRLKNVHLRLQTKIVLLTSLVLLVMGALLVFVFESTNPDTLGELPPGQQVIASFFQSATSRTAGFASIDQGAMTPASKMFTCILMFIGASPAGTGGGIKTTTFIVALLFLWTVITNKQDVELFGRRMSMNVVRRAMAITILAIFIMMAAVFVLALAEDGSEAGLSDIVFEVVSALSTTGLSTGITPGLSEASKVTLSLVMYLGRVGFLTAALNIGNLRRDLKTKNIQYPLEDIAVG